MQQRIFVGYGNKLDQRSTPFLGHYNNVFSMLVRHRFATAAAALQTSPEEDKEFNSIHLPHQAIHFVFSLCIGVKQFKLCDASLQ